MMKGTFPKDRVIQVQTKNIAEQLVAARKACGMTQEQLSEALNMSRQAIPHWETGRSLPDGEMLVKRGCIPSISMRARV